MAYEPGLGIWGHLWLHCWAAARRRSSHSSHSRCRRRRAQVEEVKGKVSSAMAGGPRAGDPGVWRCEQLGRAGSPRLTATLALRSHPALTRNPKERSS